MAKKEIKAIKTLSKKQIKEVPVEFITSGSVLMNLAASGKGRNGGWARGRVVNIVGDGSSGKTLLTLETCAHFFYEQPGNEPLLYPKVVKARVRYNNVEEVMDFPLADMYGQDFVDGVEWISTKEIEAFGRDFGKQCLEWKPGEALLYVVDSWDSLTSHEGLERFIESAEKDKAEDGSYNAEKQKYSSQFFAKICSLMEGKDITLIIISQVRANLNATMFGKKVYRAGGKALDFYTHQVPWLAKTDDLESTIEGKKWVWGVKGRAKFERNKVAKPFREAVFRILFDYGVDDIGSMIDWYYGPKVQKISFGGEEVDREQFVKYVEENNLEEDLAEMVEEKWASIERSIAPDRKAKFAAAEGK